jgi:hypothetical protein
VDPYRAMPLRKEFSPEPSIGGYRGGVNQITSHLDEIDYRCRQLQEVAEENIELTSKLAKQRLERQSEVQKLKDTLQDYK